MGEGCGAASFALFLSGLAERGHDVRVCLPATPPASATTTAGLRRDNGDRASGVRLDPEHYRGFLLHPFPTERGYVPNPRRPLPARLADRWSCWARFQRDAARAALTLAEAFPPDLVIGMGNYEAPAARRVARRLGLPNVTRLFGNCLSLHFRSPLRFYANFPEVIALRTPADLILLNDDGAETDVAARRLRVPADRLVHLRNGVDFDRFHPGPADPELRSRLGLPAGRRVLLTGTRLAAEKKLERAIAVLAGVVERGIDAALILPGDGPERGRLEAEARARGLADRVLFPGPIPQHEMPDWHRLADVFLSLLDRTNAANPVFEAMACGRPVVALDAGSTSAMVRPHETGLLIARRDLPRIGEAVGRLLEDEETRRRYGAAAARRAPRQRPEVRR
jgi:glycosyltransferase involved in cell wall biosynthesis